MKPANSQVCELCPNNHRIIAVFQNLNLGLHANLQIIDLCFVRVANG